MVCYQTPTPRRHHDHQGDGTETNHERPSEFLAYFRRFLEEVRLGGFFGGSTPAHFYGEEVGDDGLGEVEGKAAEGDSEEGNLFEVF